MIRLKELREERGLNKTEAADFLGKKYTTYINHEKGYREPNSEDLKKYSKAYGVSVDYLLGRTDERKPATERDGLDSRYSTVIFGKDKRLLEWFRSLPEEKQKAILISQDAPEDLF